MENIKEIYSLTPLQEGMLFHKMNDPHDSSYHIQETFWVNDIIDLELIRKSLNLLARKYDVLRTAFVIPKSTGKPWQVILNNREIELCIHENKSFFNVDNVVQTIQKSDLERGFDLEKDSLLRLTIIIYSEKKNMLLFSLHHIIMDGWCMSLVVGDLLRYYEQLNSGKSMNEMEKIVEREKHQTAEYSEYIKWIEEQGKEGLEYWNELLYDYNEIAEIKSTQKPQATEEQMKRIGMSLSKENSEKLARIVAKNNMTINTIAEVSWGIVLQRYNYTNDVVFGKVVSGRNVDIRGIENIVGLFINTIPLRVKSEKNMTVLELLKEVQNQGIESSAYDYCSLAEVQGHTKQSSDLIKTLLVFENYYVNEEKIKSGEKGIHIGIESAREQTNYAVSISVNYVGGILNFDVSYNPNEYVVSDMERLLMRILCVLEQIARNPEIKIEEIEVITETEKSEIFEEFNNTVYEYPKDKTVVELFEEQVTRTSQTVAVVFEDEQITYSELNKRANQLALKLRKMGVKPDDLVAIMVERSIEMIIGVYGILKSGGAYLPIDPTYPKDRIDYIIEDSKPKVVLVYKTEIETVMPVIDLADSEVYTGISTNPPNVNKPNDLAYCIYTSGTTGKPKGVMIENRNVVNYTCNSALGIMKEAFDNGYSKILSATSISFDIFVTESILPTLNGMTIYIANKDEQENAGSFSKMQERHNIEILQSTPSRVKMWLSDSKSISGFKNLKYIMMGGEKVESSLIQELVKYTSAQMVNVYGPTETTVWSGRYLINAENISNNIPIGKPISNTQIYIMNEMQLCGVDTLGELCIAGAGVARGYLNNPELTAEKFANNPFGDGKLYHTGDLARWLPDGNIEFLGRIDEQVKIRGYRIELGEIESNIKKINYVKNVAVIVREDESGDKAICAYIVSDEKVNVLEVGDALRKMMPEYMIPSYMMQIDNIPVTQNGKLNKRALPNIEVKSEREYVAPRNEMERVLCKIISEVLKIEKVGIKEDFFELGGNSIKAIRVVSKIRGAGYKVSTKDIMHGHTVEGIADSVSISDRNECEQYGAVEIASDSRVIGITIKKIEFNNLSKDKFASFIEYNSLFKYDVQNNFELVQDKTPHFIQKSFYGSQPENITFVKIQINGYQSKSNIINKVKKLIMQQPTLRMKYDESTQMMHEMAFNNRWTVPYFVANEKKENYFDTMCNCVRLSPDMFINGQLLVKIWIVEAEEDIHWIYLVAHHCIWDAMSNEILLSELRKLYRLNDQPVNIIPPNTSGAKKIPDNFLFKYNECLYKYQAIIKECRYTGRFYLYENKDSEEEDYLLCDPILYLMQKFYKFNFTNVGIKLKYIPLLVIYHGRTENEKDLLGMYLDYLPAMYDIENKKIIGGMDFVDNSYKRGKVYQQYASRYNLNQVGPIINVRLAYNESSIPTLDDKTGVQIVEYHIDDVVELDITADFIGNMMQIGLPKIEIA